MGKIASLYAEITADTSKLQSGLKQSKSGLADLNSAFQSVTGVSLSAAGAIGIVGGVLKASIAEAMSAEKAYAATVAVLKSTGDASGMTADEITRMASAIQGSVGLEDDMVQSGENMLLTFTSIGRDVFPRATNVMVDMATAMASGNLEQVNLKDTAIQLGKALNDPVVGATALQRVGVKLTETQKDQIKSFMAVNDIAGAQNVILKELETEFGGMGAAMGQTAAGQAARLKGAVADLEEELGKKLLPTLSAAAEATLTLLKWDDNLAQVMSDHNKVVEKEAKSYKDYTAEMLRANGITQEMLSTDGKMVVMGANRGQTIDHLIEKLNIDTQAEFNNARSVDRSAEAQQNWIANSNIMQNAADKNTAALALQGAAEDKLKAATDVLAISTQAYSAQLLYQQAQLVLGPDAALKLGVALGVVDEQTVYAWNSMKSLNDQYLSGAINAETYTVSVLALNDAIANLQDKTVSINYEEIYTKSWTSGGGGGGGGNDPYGAPQGPGGANGLDIVVPPGFENDSYPIRASSGERVTITPNYNLTINTSASHESMVSDFQMMQSLATVGN